MLLPAAFLFLLTSNVLAEMQQSIEKLVRKVERVGFKKQLSSLLIAAAPFHR
jgi:hypothetical protein